jgi:hypothetical protein
MHSREAQGSAGHLADDREPKVAIGVTLVVASKIDQGAAAAESTAADAAIELPTATPRLAESVVGMMTSGP